MAFPSPQGLEHSSRRVLTYMPPTLIASAQSSYGVDSYSGLLGHLPTRPYGRSQASAPNLTVQEQGQAWPRAGFLLSSGLECPGYLT